MELLPPVRFAAAVTCSKEALRKISVIVAKYGGQEKADRFMDACDALDYSAANSILDETVKELTGYDKTYTALGAFADRFPQLPELDNAVSAASSEAGKVKAIESYREQILAIIERSCKK